MWGQLLCCHWSVQSMISFLPERCCCIVLSKYMRQQFSMWKLERGWFSYFVLCGVFHYNEMHTEAFSFVLLEPPGYAFFSSLNTGSNDLGLTCCELLLAVPFPSEVWSVVAVHPRIFYFLISLFSTVTMALLPPSTTTWHCRCSHKYYAWC